MPTGTYMLPAEGEKFKHQTGLCAKSYKNLPSSFFIGMSGLIVQWV